MGAYPRFFVPILGCLLFVACGGDGGGGASPGPAPGTDTDQAIQFTEAGWSLFESAEYDSARMKFDAALAADSTYADAHNGRGWSILLRGLPPSNGPLDDAIAAFLDAMDAGLFAADPQVGLAIAYQAEGNYADAVTFALEALDLEPTYAFRHRQTLNYLDIHLVLAQSYVGQGETFYPLAQEEVDLLDPENGLDPEDQTTWAVDLDHDGVIEVGETYGSYAEALIELIELLQQEIFG